MCLLSAEVFLGRLRLFSEVSLYFSVFPSAQDVSSRVYVVCVKVYVFLLSVLTIMRYFVIDSKINVDFSVSLVYNM